MMDWEDDWRKELHRTLFEVKREEMLRRLGELAVDGKLPAGVMTVLIEKLDQEVGMW